MSVALAYEGLDLWSALLKPPSLLWWISSTQFLSIEIFPNPAMLRNMRASHLQPSTHRRVSNNTTRQMVEAQVSQIICLVDHHIPGPSSLNIQWQHVSCTEINWRDNFSQELSKWTPRSSSQARLMSSEPWINGKLTFSKSSDATPHLRRLKWLAILDILCFYILKFGIGAKRAPMGEEIRYKFKNKPWLNRKIIFELESY